jgi:ABC-type uncharacterized transport system permease subunit
VGREGNGDGKGTGRSSLPGWRFAFFALVIVIVLVGGKWLNIPATVQVPVLIGCLLALANGYLPTWFGKDK